MYTHPTLKYWNGRIDSQTELDSFRYHQRVRLAPISELATSSNASRTFGLIGFKCDEGVRRNKGRVGAAEGPDHIR
ncbi:hypothetical protein ABEW17_08340 [Peribacillus frigoritolerans]